MINRATIEKAMLLWRVTRGGIGKKFKAKLIPPKKLKYLSPSGKARLLSVLIELGILEKVNHIWHRWLREPSSLAEKITNNSTDNQNVEKVEAGKKPEPPAKQKSKEANLSEAEKEKMEQLWAQTQGAAFNPENLVIWMMGFSSRRGFVFFSEKLASKGFLRELADDFFEWIRRPDGTPIKKKKKKVYTYEPPRKRNQLVGFNHRHCTTNQGLMK